MPAGVDATCVVLWRQLAPVLGLALAAGVTYLRSYFSYGIVAERSRGLRAHQRPCAKGRYRTKAAALHRPRDLGAASLGTLACAGAKPTKSARCTTRRQIGHTSRCAHVVAMPAQRQTARLITKRRVGRSAFKQRDRSMSLGTAVLPKGRSRQF